MRACAIGSKIRVEERLAAANRRADKATEDNTATQAQLAAIQAQLAAAQALLAQYAPQ